MTNLSYSQVCWEKTCRYFEMEPRYVDLSEDCFVLTPEGAAAACDENTVGVCAIVGSTYNGAFEDVAGICAKLAELNERHGWEIKVHVDGASGGWIAAFLYPELQWDFRNKLVCSINVSGHKYGLVYPGLGWLLFRDEAMLPASLIFETHYLGSVQQSITLNFSKSAATIIAQYFMLIRLGRAGYRRIFENLRSIASRLADGVMATGAFRLLSDDHSLPLVAFSFLPYADGRPRAYDEFSLSDKLRERGWVLPAYSMAPNAQHIKLVRAVVREDLGASMVDQLIKDITKAVLFLEHFHGGAKLAVDAAPATAAPAPSSLAKWNEEHHPHRVHSEKKKHPGVC